LMNTLRIAVQEKRYNMHKVIMTDIAYHFTNRDAPPALISTPVSNGLSRN